MNSHRRRLSVSAVCVATVLAVSGCDVLDRFIEGAAQGSDSRAHETTAQATSGAESQEPGRRHEHLEGVGERNECPLEPRIADTYAGCVVPSLPKDVLLPSLPVKESTQQNSHAWLVDYEVAGGTAEAADALAARITADMVAQGYVEDTTYAAIGVHALTKGTWRVAVSVVLGEPAFVRAQVVEQCLVDHSC